MEGNAIVLKGKYVQISHYAADVRFTAFFPAEKGELNAEMTSELDQLKRRLLELETAHSDLMKKTESDAIILQGYVTVK